MKKQINGKSYNTESANKLARIDSGHSPSDFEYWEETLYRTKTGNFFLYGWGRGNSRYGDGDKIIPMEQEEVMEWVEHNLPSIDGEFIQWFSEHKNHRIEEKQKNCKGSKGIRKGNAPGTYQAAIRVDNVPYYLGQYDSREAAMQIRLQAEQAKENGEFIQWFSEHKKHRIEEKHKKQRGVYKGNTPGTYRATIGVDNVSYYLGQHDSREAAMQVRLQAEQAKENDNFIQWFSEHFPDRWAKMQNKNMNKEKKHD